MTDTMFERVARAISGAPFPSAASRRKARAAIEAMREPTQAMKEAAYKADPTGYPQLTWRVQIDVVLQENSHERV